MIIPFDAGALGEDRDATFFFQIIGIHRALFNALIIAKRPRLAEQLVNKGRFAMIDVRDDGHIAEAHLKYSVLRGDCLAARLAEFVRCGKDGVDQLMHAYCPTLALAPLSRHVRAPGPR